MRSFRTSASVPSGPLVAECCFIVAVEGNAVLSQCCCFLSPPLSTPLWRPVHRRARPKTRIPARCGVLRELPCRAAPADGPCARRLSWSLFGCFGAGGCLACPLLRCALSPPSILSFSAQTRPNERRAAPETIHDIVARRVPGKPSPGLQAAPPSATGEPQSFADFGLCFDFKEEKKWRLISQQRSQHCIYMTINEPYIGQA